MTWSTLPRIQNNSLSREKRPRTTFHNPTNIFTGVVKSVRADLDFSSWTLTCSDRDSNNIENDQYRRTGENERCRIDTKIVRSNDYF